MSSELERFAIQDLRTWGCKCKEPLLGWRPEWGPRCRLCNTENPNRAWKAEAEKEIARQRRRATDAEYMSLAFRNMLGPKGQEVATMWDARGVTRVHFDWGPDASEMTGEQRAEFILSIENLPSTPLDFNDGKGPRTNRAARRLVEKEDGRHG